MVINKNPISNIFTITMSLTERTVSNGIFNMFSESILYPFGTSPSEEITRVFNFPELESSMTLVIYPSLSPETVVTCLSRRSDSLISILHVKIVFTAPFFTPSSLVYKSIRNIIFAASSSYRSKSI